MLFATMVPQKAESCEQAPKTPIADKVERLVVQFAYQTFKNPHQHKAILHHATQVVIPESSYGETKPTITKPTEKLIFYLYTLGPNSFIEAQNIAEQLLREYRIGIYDSDIKKRIPKQCLNKDENTTVIEFTLYDVMTITWAQERKNISSAKELIKKNILSLYTEKIQKKLTFIDNANETFTIIFGEYNLYTKFYETTNPIIFTTLNCKVEKEKSSRIERIHLTVSHNDLLNWARILEEQTQPTQANNYETYPPPAPPSPR